MNNFYDFIVIGSGISACTFASSLNKIFSDSSILLVEHGRRIGGRSSTRKSRRNKILEFDHGLPSINLSKKISPDVFKLIYPLIKSNKLIDITNKIVLINELGDIDYSFINEKVYRCLPFMSNLSKEIINQSINPQKINFIFNTFAKSILRKNNFWEVIIKDKEVIRSTNLILSSSLIAHPRCLNILDINSIPLRDALINGKDEIVDLVLTKVEKQQHLKRKNYILYVQNTKIVKNFNHQYLQILFSQNIRFRFNFERIIFQEQKDGSMIIVLHCAYINNSLDLDSNKIIDILISIFFYQTTVYDLLLHSKIFDSMIWNASQPINNLVPKELQWSSISNIGFCGDWFDFEGLGPAETAMNSSIRLSKLLSSK